uniref:Uncharacterized protein n=1 Tax=Anguilla anguilla TaxID=7936 RepID=A0A0E9Q8M3_ANGAN
MKWQLSIRLSVRLPFPDQLFVVGSFLVKFSAVFFKTVI